MVGLVRLYNVGPEEFGMLLNLVEHLLSGLVLDIHRLLFTTCIASAHKFLLSLNSISKLRVAALAATDIFLDESIER